MCEFVKIHFFEVCGEKRAKILIDEKVAYVVSFDDHEDFMKQFGEILLGENAKFFVLD